MVGNSLYINSSQMKTPDVSWHDEPIFRLHSTAFIKVIKAVTNPRNTTLRYTTIDTRNQWTTISARAFDNYQVLVLFYLRLAAYFEAPQKVILIKAVRAQSVQSISPLALPISQFFLITDNVNELYLQLDILQSMMSLPPEMLIDEIISALGWPHYRSLRPLLYK